MNTRSSTSGKACCNTAMASGRTATSKFLRMLCRGVNRCKRNNSKKTIITAFDPYVDSHLGSQVTASRIQYI
jgi:hypothetical protein